MTERYGVMFRFPVRATTAVAVLSLLAACGGGSSSGSSSSGELREVTFGSQQVAADAGLFIADSLGYFRDAGIEVTFERMNDASAITNSLATGHLDVAGATVTPGTFQAGAKNLGIKIVGDKNFMAPPRAALPAMSGTRMAARPEFDKGDLRATFEALRGRKLAIHSELSIQVVYLDMLLKKYGFSRSDFEITPVLSPNQTAALQNGAIDAAVMQEPYFSQAIARGIVKPVSDMTEELPPTGVSTTALLFGKQFLQDRDTAQRFMNAYVRGVRTYNDAMFFGKDKDRIVAIVADAVGAPVEDIATTNPAGLDPDQVIDQDWLNTCQEFYRANGMLDVQVDVADLVDTSFRDAAIKELGPYEPPAA
jgi:NitT/TauT family transport system substrate-binding protein